MTQDFMDTAPDMELAAAFEQEPRAEAPAQPPAQIAPPTLEQAQDAAVYQHSIAAQQFQIGSMIGQFHAFDAQAKFGELSRTILLKQMQDDKSLYRGASFPLADGTLKEMRTFEDVCEYMGISVGKAKEDVRNLRVFGEEFMETASNLGIGYQQLRKLRALPEDDRAAITEAANDPEVLKDLLEERAAKHAKEKEEMETKIKDQAATLKGRTDRLEKREKEIDELTTQLEKINSLDVDERAQAAKAREQTLVREIALDYLRIAGAFDAANAKALAFFEDASISPSAKELILSHISGICSTIADETLNAGINVDFRILCYPPEIDTLLRGDAERAEMFAEELAEAENN